MTGTLDRINRLDTTLFHGVPSQNTEDDRRALLAIQRAAAREFNDFVYLEIGSYLGGSLQPYVVDPRCRLIHSIDPRPVLQRDSNSYEDNSAEHMLRLLAGVDPVGVSKVRSYWVDASEVDTKAVNPRPHVSSIDGDHTRDAVLSDFRFCRAVTAPDGIIAFHDSQFRDVTPAIWEIVRDLRRDGRRFAAVKFYGAVFALFLDEDLVRDDSFLAEMWSRDRTWLSRSYRRLRLSSLGKTYLPGPVVDGLRYERRLVHGSAAAPPAE